jgi:hypothetical protein
MFFILILICCWLCRLEYFNTFIVSNIIGLDIGRIDTHMPLCLFPWRFSLSHIPQDWIWIIWIWGLFSWTRIRSIVRHVCSSESVFTLDDSDTYLLGSQINQSRCCTSLVTSKLPSGIHMTLRILRRSSMRLANATCSILIMCWLSKILACLLRLV